MKMVFKGERLLTIGKGAKNSHQLSLEAKLSFVTVNKYVNHPEKLQAFDLQVFPALLINGCGLTKEEFLNLRLGDLFDLEDADRPGA